MRRFTAVLAGLALAATAPAASAAPIIGGTEVTTGEFPSVVAIITGDGLCTGILIRKDWVITAAHCMDPSIVGEANQAAVTSSVLVFFSTKSITAGGKKVRAVETFYDTRYDNDQSEHDVGLVHLAEPVDYAPSPLNFDATKAPVGISTTQVGFGTRMEGDGSAQGDAGLEYVITAQKSVSCTAYQLSDGDLLCFNQTSGKGKCEGDSGGPSFATIDGVQTVVGLTSFGDQSCSIFGADTRTEADKDFILSHVPELDCTNDAGCGSGETCFNSTCMADPFSPSGIGSACTTGSDCDSDSCVTGPGSDALCSMGCTPGLPTSCPTGFDCLAHGSGTGPSGLCWPTDAESGGGSSGGGCDAGTHGAPALVIGLGLFGLVLRRRRR